MTSPAKYPVPTYEVAFDTDPLAAPVYTDLSSRLKAYSYGYGKQSATGEFQPGWLRTLLKNDDRALDKLNAAGAYYGKLNPRKRERLKLTVGGVTYDQMTTFGDGWPMSQFTPTTSVIEHASTDVTIILSGVDLPDSVWVLEVSADSPAVWYRLGETTGTVLFDKAAGSNGMYGLALDRLSTDGLIAFDADKAINCQAFGDLGVDSLARPVTTVPAVGSIDAVPSALPVVLEIVTRPSRPADSTTVLLEAVLASRPTFQVRLSLDSSDEATFNADAGWVPDAYPSMGRSLSTVSVYPFNTSYVIAAKFDTGVEELWFNGIQDAAAGVNTSIHYTNKNSVTIGGYTQPGEVNPFTGVLDEVLFFDVALSSARIQAHADAAFTPWTGDTTGERLQRIADYLGLLAADVSFDVGTVTLGPTGLGGDGWAYMQKVARTEGGDLFVEHRNAGKLTFRDCYEPLTASRSTTPQAVFTDDPAAGAGAYRFEPDGLVLTDDESQVINEAVVKWAQGEARYRDDTSKADHGLKSRTFDTLLATQQEAQSYAEWIVDHYKDAPTRVESITLNPGGDQTLWVPALGLRYGDRVTFRFKPQNTGTAIQTDYLVCGMVADADPQAREFKVTYYLSPVDIQRPYAIWGTGLWGTGTWGK